jgi:hypothetical protein
MLAHLLIALAVSAAAQPSGGPEPGQPGAATVVPSTAPPSVPASTAAPVAQPTYQPTEQPPLYQTPPAPQQVIPPSSPLGPSGTAPVPPNPPPPPTNIQPYPPPRGWPPPVPSTGPASGAQISTAPVRQIPEPPASISGLVLMPTAYRGIGRDPNVGLGLDFNAAYYIGRLYGKNNFAWTLDKTNYIDRIGQWLLTGDGKMQIQSEGEYRPAVAVGAMGMLAFRDAPQPSVGSTTGSTVNANVKKSTQLGGVYVVASKRFFNNFVPTIGYTEGDLSEIFGLLTDYLTPNALTLEGQTGRTASSSGMLYGGVLIQTSPTRVFAIELMKPQGMVLNPLLINLNLGTLLKLNFQLSYLTFQGGYDVLGMIQFRYSQFPR